MYCQDYNERFCPAGKWGDALQLYIRNTNIFACPSLALGQAGFNAAFVDGHVKWMHSVNAGSWQVNAANLFAGAPGPPVWH